MKSVLVPLPPLDWGGLQVFAVNINAGLRAAGWRWVAVVPPHATTVIERLRDGGVDVVPAPLARFRRSPVATLRSLIDIPRDIAALARSPAANVDLVQAVGAHHPHGLLLARKLGKPLVWQLHSSILPPPLRKLVAPFIKQTADVVMTNGRTIACDFWGRPDLGPDHFVFYAPVDADRFAPNAAARAACRRELGFRDGDVVIGTVGNRAWQKNHELLIAAAQRIVPQNPSLRFLVLGAPVAAYEDVYRRNVIEPARALNSQHSNSVTFLSPGNTVAKWVHAIDIFTLTSHAEGVPIALLEAMAAAKPVVSSRVGSIDEIVVEGVTGRLVERGNLEELGDRLMGLASDPEQQRSFGNSGRMRVLREFTLSSVVAAHVEAYDKALAAAR